MISKSFAVETFDKGTVASMCPHHYFEYCLLAFKVHLKSKSLKNDNSSSKAKRNAFWIDFMIYRIISLSNQISDLIKHTYSRTMVYLKTISKYKLLKFKPKL